MEPGDSDGIDEAMSLTGGRALSTRPGPAGCSQDEEDDAEEPDSTLDACVFAT